MKYDLHGEEKIVGKGETAGYPAFLLFPQYFEKLSFVGSLKVRIMCILPNDRILDLFKLKAFDYKKLKVCNLSRV